MKTTVIRKKSINEITKQLRICKHVPEAAKNARDKNHFFIESCGLLQCMSCGLIAHRDNLGRYYVNLGHRQIPLGVEYDGLGAMTWP